jgi:enterochelin esterase-like enzyme
MEAGEEVAYGDPYVSDAERAAAGRETLAERTRALLPANRERAAARYASGEYPADPAKRSEVRAQEYLPRYKPRRFAAHLSFVSGEVIPWAAAEFPVAGGPWISAGFSNGAAWAIGAAQRRPDVFGGVAAFSAGIVPQRVAGPSRGVRHFLAAGTLEEGFRRATREWAERLRRAGVPYSHREWAGGHDPFWWQHYLPDALAWLLG